MFGLVGRDVGQGATAPDPCVIGPDLCGISQSVWRQSHGRLCGKAVALEALGWWRLEQQEKAVKCGQDRKLRRPGIYDSSVYDP